MRTTLGTSSSRWRLGVRLFTALTLITILLYVLSTLFALYWQQRNIKESLIKEGQSLSEIYAESLRTAVFAEDEQAIASVVQMITLQEGVVSVAVFSDSGKPLFRWSRMAEYAVNSPAPSGQIYQVIENSSSFQFYRPIAIDITENSEEALFSGDPKKIKKTVGYISLVTDKTKLKSAMKKMVFLNMGMAAIFIFSIATGIYFTVRKITGPFESRMVEMEKMEAVGTLARGIAHDFNNILGAAKGYLYVLGKKLKENELSELVVYTEGSLDRAKKLVESLLSFSRADSNKFALFDINDAVKSLRSTVGPFTAGRYVYRELLSERPLTIKGDRLQIEQVVMNLVNNALDAMGDTGIVTIETGAVTIDSEDVEAFGLRCSGRFACIMVQDTGSGIDDSLKSKIFEPFFTTKEVGKGTGLGLAIVYEIVKEHKGLINVDSVRGKGTSFKVYLPLIT